MNRRNQRRFISIGLAATLAVSIILNGVLWQAWSAASGTMTSLSRRVSALEKVSAAREAADPLMPAECGIAEGMGATRERPCLVEFQRLYRSPQQFVGRWVMVEGRYATGFEMNALFPPAEHFTYQTADRMLSSHRGIWVAAEYREGANLQKLSVVGKFKPGPAGHMGQYFGELAEAHMQ
jgi:hypothetical protein